MVKAFLDTSVIVDALRKYPPAIAFIANSNDIGLSHAVWLESLDGAINKLNQQRTLQLLRQFRRVEFENEDFYWAVDQLTIHRLRLNVGMMDCLIAAPAHRLQLPLYTRNLKHFAPLLGALTVKPY
jgi:predicted nucleic acid-binding protein